VRAPDIIAYGIPGGVEGFQLIFFISQGVKGVVKGSLGVLDDVATSLHDHCLVFFAALSLMVGKESGVEGVVLGDHGHVELFDCDRLALNQLGQLHDRRQ